MVIDPINDPEGAKKAVKDSQLPPMGFGSPSDGVISTTLGGEPQNKLHTPIPDAVPKPIHLNDLSGVHNYLGNANNQDAQAQGEKQANHDQLVNGYRNTPSFKDAAANGNQESNSEKSKNPDENPTKQGETSVTPASGETSSLGSQTPTESKATSQNQGSEQPVAKDSNPYNIRQEDRDALNELRNRHSQDKNADNPTPKEPQETGDRNIT